MAEFIVEYEVRRGIHYPIQDRDLAKAVQRAAQYTAARDAAAKATTPAQKATAKDRLAKMERELTFPTRAEADAAMADLQGQASGFPTGARLVKSLRVRPL